MRKSTVKYEVVTLDSNSVVFEGSNTDCKKMMSSMNIKGRSASVYVRKSK